MDPLVPFPTLEVTDPDGQPYRTVQVPPDRLTIGRFEAYNDLALVPDPQQLLSRKGHCALERDALGWWVVDNGTINGTFLVRGGEMQQVIGRERLQEGDTIRLLGLLPETGALRYWELIFRDPQGTQPLGVRPELAALGGTSPVPFESGKYASVHQRHACINRCVMRCTNLLGLWTSQEPWAEAYYQRKRKEGKTHSMAVRALSNVWVRIIYALWRKHEPYQAATFLASQQAHGCLVV